jgi:membrane peptidoglycan carboxypeptidase
MAALVESPPLRSQTSSPVHSVQGSTATFGHGRVSFDLHTPPSVLKQHQQQSQQQYSSTDHTVSAPVTSDLTTNRTTIPELNVNGTAVISPEPRPRKASTASNARGDAGAAGGKEGESQWGANFWVTLIEPQVCILVMHCSVISLCICLLSPLLFAVG